jgi:hypothetical protein
MIDYTNISEALYSAAANSIRTISEHYSRMIQAGMKPADVLTRMVQHLDAINLSTADEASKSKAKAELLDFASKNLADADGWPVASGLFDGNYVPDGWIKEDLDEATTPDTHVLFHNNFGKFHGVINSRPIKPMTEPELTRHLLRDHGMDKDKAADMIGQFKTGNPLGEKLHNSTLSVDGAMKHAQHALAQHLAGNHSMRDNHLAVAHVHMDAALDALKKDDPGVVHHLPKKLEVLQNTTKAFPQLFARGLNANEVVATSSDPSGAKANALPTSCHGFEGDRGVLADWLRNLCQSIVERLTNFIGLLIIERAPRRPGNDVTLDRPQSLQQQRGGALETVFAHGLSPIRTNCVNIKLSNCICCRLRIEITTTRERYCSQPLAFKG